VNTLIIGLGYVGLPIAIRAAEAGHTVIGVDVSAEKVDALHNKHSYVEDVSDERLARVQRSGAFSAYTTDMFDQFPKRFEVALITVPTPVDGFKRPDLGFIEDAARYVATHMHGGELVILESTTYPGTTEDVVAEVIVGVNGMMPGKNYDLGYSPERINPGDSVNTFQRIPKIVSGVGDSALVRVQEFYATLVDKVVPVSNPRTAEMAKIFENSWANINVALVNEFALMCSELDIDVDEMLDAAATKGHNIVRMKPGLGTGGHCLPIDPLYMAWLRRNSHGKAFKFAELADEINSHMPVHAVQRIRAILKDAGVPIYKSRVLVLGTAYKPGIADTRESPSVTLVELLREAGADVTVSDPHVYSESDARLAAKSAGSFDIVVVATAHPEFDYDLVLQNAVEILDTRNVYPQGAERVHKL
jgi:UDP-N-acetyl-D-glucosamine dehydrogenase